MMTSPTGINRRGFSLIEVMIAVCILSLGTVVIHQNFLRSAAYFGRYSSQLKTSLWVYEKAWEAREKSVYSKPGEEETGASQGQIEIDRRSYGWGQDVTTPAEKDLFYIKTLAEWQEGQSVTQFVHETYDIKKDIPRS